jgi:hypothetical protein
MDRPTGMRSRWSCREPRSARSEIALTQLLFRTVNHTPADDRVRDAGLQSQAEPAELARHGVSRSPTAEIVGLSLLYVERAQPYEGVG